MKAYLLIVIINGERITFAMRTKKELEQFKKDCDKKSYEYIHTVSKVDIHDFIEG